MTNLIIVEFETENSDICVCVLEFCGVRGERNILMLMKSLFIVEIDFSLALKCYLVFTGLGLFN